MAADRSASGGSVKGHGPFAVWNRTTNRLVRFVLRSPLHSILSRRMLLITVTGRRSGREYTFPVRYEQDGDQVKIGVGWPQRKRWWRNLRDEAPVRVRIRGAERHGRAVARGTEQSGVTVEVSLASEAAPRPGAGESISDWGGVRASIRRLVRPTSEAELRVALRDAAEEGLPVSLRGCGHSTGGQSLCDGGLAIDLRGLDRVLDLDPTGQTVRVQGGATWRALTEVLEPLRLGVTTKQEFETFTIGGSIAANVHGKSIDHGPLIGGVRSLRLMKADGEIVTASRESNPELFRAVVGGYGLFGVVVDATLDLIADRPVTNGERAFDNAGSLIGRYLDRIDGDRDRTPLCYGFLDQRLRRGFYVAYTYVDDGKTYELDQLKRHDPPPALFNAFVGLQHRSSLVRRAAPRLTWAAGLRRELTLRSRRLLLWDDPPAGFERTRLQKYAVPVASFAAFVERAGEVLGRHRDRLSVLTPHFRFIPGSDEAMLSLAPEDSVCLIPLHLAKPGDRRWEAAYEQVTAELIEACIDAGGRHYLTFDAVASRDQLLRAYPRWDEFVALKRRHDPDGLFTSSFFRRYEGD